MENMERGREMEQNKNRKRKTRREEKHVTLDKKGNVRREREEGCTWKKGQENRKCKGKLEEGGSGKRLTQNLISLIEIEITKSPAMSTTRPR